MAHSIHDKVSNAALPVKGKAVGKSVKGQGTSIETASANQVQRLPVANAASASTSNFTRALSIRSTVSNLLDAAIELEESLVRVGALPSDTLGYTYRSIQQQAIADRDEDNSKVASSNIDYPLNGLEALSTLFHVPDITVIHALDISRAASLSVLAMLAAAVDGSLEYTLPLASTDDDIEHDQYLSNNSLGRRVHSYSIFINGTVRNIRSAVGTLHLSILGLDGSEDLKRDQPQGIASTLVDVEDQMVQAARDIQQLNEVVANNLL